MLQHVRRKEAIDLASKVDRDTLHIIKGPNTQFPVRETPAGGRNLECRDVKAGLGKLVAAVAPRATIIEEPAARFETELQQDADVIGKAFISVSEVGALHLGQRRIAGEVDGEPLHIFILVIGLIGFWPVRRGATGRFRNDEAG